MPCKTSLQLPRIPTTARWRTEWLMSGSSRIGFLVTSGLSRVGPGRSQRTKTKKHWSHQVHRTGPNWDSSWHVGWDDDTATVGKAKEIINKMFSYRRETALQGAL